MGYETPAAGELLVSVADAEHASMTTAGLERRTVDIRDREARLDVDSIRPIAATA